MVDGSSGSLTDYLAAERTFLAWIRTGLALMGFGFVVARFGLFLRALGQTESRGFIGVHGSSFWFGPVLILLGVIVTALSAWNHFSLIRTLNRRESPFDHPSWLGLGLAVVLAAIGVAMTIYLISVRDPPPGYREEQEESSMATTLDNGITTLPSRHSVDDTVARLEELLKTKGVKLFALIDHSGEAEKVGLQLRPTKVLIFGNPKAGTPLMVASPTIALDLPLKVLISEDAAGAVWVSYNTPAYLQARHGLSADLLQNIAVVGGLSSSAAE
jgi:uncharacterized protein (DUF302 family)/uncharacterized membrane protein YidH (DUF202 family)